MKVLFVALATVMLLGSNAHAYYSSGSSGRASGFSNLGNYGSPFSQIAGVSGTYSPSGSGGTWIIGPHGITFSPGTTIRPATGTPVNGRTINGGKSSFNNFHTTNCFGSGCNG